MKTIRIIPRLDIKGPNLVKGIHLEGLRVLGKPEDFAQYYYENGADELIYQDVVASLYERNSLKDIISKTAKKIFIPLTVGGGIRTIDDINNVLRAGADKVCINTAAIKEPDLIRRASRKFGSSTIVVAIEVIKSNDAYLAYTDNGREFTGVDAIEWANKVEELGAGELLITSVDKEGTGEGFDLELVKTISNNVSIPVIAHGGASSYKSIEDVFKIGKADAVAIASVLHYALYEKLFKLGEQHIEGNVEFATRNIKFKKITPMSLCEIKRFLLNNGLNVRFNER